VEELKQLRVLPPLFAADVVTVRRGQPFALSSSSWDGRGNQSEIAVTFAIPSAPASFGIIISSSSSSGGGGGGGGGGGDGPSAADSNASLVISIAYDSFAANLSLQSPERTGAMRSGDV
jgi:hypothetical protein